jgi:hypothetical protein
MKVIQISDELYGRLKNCVVDPFDDTPESVIGRLIDVTDKAKNSWSPLDSYVQDAKPKVESQDKQSTKPEHWRKQSEAVL